MSPSAANMAGMSSPSPSPPPPPILDDVGDTGPHLAIETNLALREPKVERLKTPTTPSSRRPSLQSRNSMNGPLYMQTSNNKVFIRRVKGKGDGAVKSLTRWLLDNQIGRPAAHGFIFNLACLVSSPLSRIHHASESLDGVWRVGIGLLSGNRPCRLYLT